MCLCKRNLDKIVRSSSEIRITARLLLTLAVACCIITTIVSADNYVGGLPIETVKTGTVTGGLYIDVTPAPDWGNPVVTKTFTLPDAAVEEPGRIVWARLYISAYVGHMQNDYAFTITNKLDSDGDGTYEKTWPEKGHEAFNFLYEPFTGEIIGNDNSEFPGHGDHEPYLIINDHENRVTSDYLMWYDVRDLIEGKTVKVNVDTTGSYDGRIKMITLVVAYNDPASTTKTTYWVNQGHDACSYYTEDAFGEVAMGTTGFDTTGLSGFTSATLTIDYLASNNGYYGFPTAKNNFDAGARTGGFTKFPLDRVADIQGAYSGVDSWDVTDKVTGDGKVTLAFSRYLPATGIAAFYKLPLAFLVVKSPLESVPVADFDAAPVSGSAPLTVEFADKSTGEITSRSWDFDNDGTIDSTARTPSHTYEEAGTYTVTLRVNGPGGENEETKEAYITVAPTETPIAGFLADPTEGTVPLTVTFKDESENHPTAWTWEFRESGSEDWLPFSFEQDPEYIFANTGTYDIRLTAENRAGSDEKTQEGYITVNDAPPAAGFTASPRSGYAPLAVTFADESTGTITGLAWDFDNDGIPDSTEQNPVHTYEQAGIYNVSLTVTGPGGSTRQVRNGYITVSAAGITERPAAGFSAYDTVVKVDEKVSFTDESKGVVTSWAWDFNSDDINDSYEQDPVTSYAVPGKYSVTLIVSGPGGSNELKKTNYINVKGDPTCDLAISGTVSPINLGGTVFAKEPNTIRIGVVNNGPSTSSQSSVEVAASDGYKTRATVPALANGANVTLTVVDSTDRKSSGGIIWYNATVDPDDDISETDENNNFRLSTDKTVTYNGYKGKRYQDGGDVETRKTYDLNGSIVHSFGDSKYRSGSFGGSGWTSYTVTWEPDDLTIPSNATIKKAILYVPYTWDNSNEVDTITISFNGGDIPHGSIYKDESNFGAYKGHVYGLIVYDVTDAFWKNDKNTALFSRATPNAKLSMNGFILAVIYEDPSESRKQIFINEEYDLLGADETNYATTEEEATAYVPFSGMTIDPASAKEADLITFVPFGDMEGNLLFNNVRVDSGWDFGSVDSPQVAVKTTDVKSSLKKTGNIAAIQSTAIGGTPCMAAIQQFLIIDYGGAAEKSNATAALAANFTAEPQNGTAPLTVNFTSLSEGNPTRWAWDFEDDGIIDARGKNPQHVFDTPGNYSVNLTVGNATAFHSFTRAAYIHVLNGTAENNVTIIPTLENQTGYLRESQVNEPRILHEVTLSVDPVTTIDPRHSPDLIVHLRGFCDYVASEISGFVSSILRSLGIFDRWR